MQGKGGIAKYDKPHRGFEEKEFVFLCWPLRFPIFRRFGKRSKALLSSSSISLHRFLPLLGMSKWGADWHSKHRRNQLEGATEMNPYPPLSL